MTKMLGSNNSMNANHNNYINTECEKNTGSLVNLSVVELNLSVMKR